MALTTSKRVTRFRCPDCASPLYAALGGGHTVAVPRSLLFRRGLEEELQDSSNGKEDAALRRGFAASFHPTHHMYYANRTLDMYDDLPKYVGTSTPGRGVLWQPKGE